MVARRPDPRAPRPPWVQVRRGVFATWRTAAGALRGCIGFPEPSRWLNEAVAQAAVQAALHDPRFDPVTLVELPTLSLELSVLSPPTVVQDPLAVRAGEHGVIVRQGSWQGLLLPQVATEYGWDRDMLLAQACVKAGLAPDAWQQGATLSVFTAEVFGEGGV